MYSSTTCLPCSVTYSTEAALMLHLGIKHRLINGILEEEGKRTIALTTRALQPRLPSKPEEEEDTIPYSPTLDKDEQLDIAPEKESDKTEEKIMSIQKEASSDKKVVKSITPLKKKRHQCALCGKELKFPGYLANHYITDHFMDRLKAEAQEAFTGEQCTKCTRY